MATKIKIPGTDWLMLEGDSAHGAAAIKSGKLITETSIASLKEVLALKAGDVVLDVGAFVGDTAAIFLERGCEVYAFEPYHDAYECLVHNCPKAHNYNRVVGDGCRASAAGRMGEPDSENLGTRMATLDDRSPPSFRIDSLNLPMVDFAKIDCEGFEVYALRGMRETIARCKPVLLIEAYDSLLKMQGFTRQDIFDELRAYQFRYALGEASNDRVDIMFFP
jgi:FkbM family methyltransferase